ncbi:hypothetical protein D3C86_1901680 [compost metagenome]
MLVVGQVADRGEYIHVAVGRARDGHSVAGDFQRALGDDDVTLVGGDALLVVQLGVVGLDMNGLVAVSRQCPGAHASQCCAQTEQKREGFNEPHTVLLRWTTG